MTHSENKVRWCLKKAEKELAEKEEHRGLIQIEPNLEEAQKHIKKAQHNFLAINYFAKGNFSDWSMSAVFYCIYHCLLAIALKFGYESRNQECTIALIKSLKENKEISLDEKFINALENYDEAQRHKSNIIEKREFYTYGTKIAANLKEIEENLQMCKECLDSTKDIVLN